MKCVESVVLGVDERPESLPAWAWVCACCARVLSRGVPGAVRVVGEGGEVYIEGGGRRRSWFGGLGGGRTTVLYAV